MWSLRSSGHTNSLLLGKDDGRVLFREHTVVLVRLGEWPFHHFSGVWGAAVLPTETCHGSPLVHFQDHKWSLGCCKVQNNLSLPPHCSLPDVCSPSSVSDSRLSSSSRRLSRRGLRIKGVSSSLEPCHDDKVVLLLEAFWQRGSVKCPLQVPPCLMSLSDSFSANLKAVRDGGAVAHCFGHPVPVDWVHGALCYSCNR